MKRQLAICAAGVVGTVAALVIGVQPANAWPTSITFTNGHNPTGVYFTAGTGSIRAYQDCETSNGQTDYTINGPWVGINTWSWSGSCGAIYRGHGFDTANS